MKLQAVARRQPLQRLARPQGRQRTLQSGESSLINCAIPLSALNRASRQHVLDADREPAHHGGNGRDVVEMGAR